MHMILQTIWTVCAPCLGLALIVRTLFNYHQLMSDDGEQLALFLRHLPIEDPIDSTFSQEKLSNDGPLPAPKPSS